MKKISVILMILLIFPFVASCKEVNVTDTSSTTSKIDGTAYEEDVLEGDYSNMQNVFLIQMENGGKIVLQLYPDIAPITVANFTKLVSEGFYDGLIFHRVMSGFMIQGGDPKGNGSGGSKDTIKGEFSLNKVKNDLSHTRGVISMARSDAYDSASSQFFIVHADSTFLNTQYAAFGKVLEGMDIVDKIAAVKVNADKKPLTEQKIKSITILSTNTTSESNASTDSSANSDNSDNSTANSN